MIRLAPALFAVALSGAPLLVAPVKVVGAAGLVGLLLAAAGIIASWRWPLTAASCAFLVEYALALLVADAPVNIVGAAAFGLGIVLLVESADLASRARRAVVGRAVIWSQLGHWVGLGGGILVTALVALALAQGLATALPFAATPFLAAAGAVGMMIGLALVIAHAARPALRGTPPGPPRIEAGGIQRRIGREATQDRECPGRRPRALVALLGRGGHR